MAADGGVRLTDSSAVLSDVAYQSIPPGGSAALRGMNAHLQTFVCVVCRVGRRRRRRWHWRPPRAIDAQRSLGLFGHVQLGPVEEQLMELPTGAQLLAETLTERVRLVGANCLAKVSSGTAFRTDWGEAMASQDVHLDVSMSQAQMLSATMNDKRQALERWSGGSKWRVARTSAQRRLWTRSTRKMAV